MGIFSCKQEANKNVEWSPLLTAHNITLQPSVVEEVLGKVLVLLQPILRAGHLGVDAQLLHDCPCPTLLHTNHQHIW